MGYSQEMLDRRRAEAPPSAAGPPLFASDQEQVLQADEGCDFRFLKGRQETDAGEG
jgi:hypothetical protein